MSRGSHADYELRFCGWGRCRQHAEPGIGICLQHAIKAHAYITERANSTVSQLKLEASLTQQPPQPQPSSHVYAMRFGDLVKIGFTTNLPARMTAIPHDELVGLAEGGRVEEKRVHAVLAKHRHNGEWFRYNDEVSTWIAEHMPLPRSA